MSEITLQYIFTHKLLPQLLSRLSLHQIRSNAIVFHFVTVQPHASISARCPAIKRLNRIGKHPNPSHGYIRRAFFLEQIASKGVPSPFFSIKKKTE